MPAFMARSSEGASCVGLLDVVVITSNLRAMRLLKASTCPCAEAVTGPVYRKSMLSLAASALAPSSLALNTDRPTSFGTMATLMRLAVSGVPASAARSGEADRTRTKAGTRAAPPSR